MSLLAYNGAMTCCKKSLTIIGGGASGLVAAIAAATQAKDQGADLRIQIIEKDDRIGRSILVTGNGRCNFSNAHIQVDRYYHAEFVNDVLAAFKSPTCSAGPVREEDLVHGFFRDLGLVWREEADGREYPLANKASVVLDVLRSRIAELGVSVTCDREACAIEAPGRKGNQFMLKMKDGTILHADCVVVACGGRNVSSVHFPLVSSEPLEPTLGPLRVSACDRAFTRELDNIRMKAEVSLWRKREDCEIETSDASYCEDGWVRLASETGELMFRKYGLSGICIFDLSRSMREGDKLRMNFLSAIDQDPYTYIVQRYQDLFATLQHSLTYEDMLRGLILPRVAEALLKREGIEIQKTLEPDDLNDLVRFLAQCEVSIEGIGDVDLCQVMRGGLDVGAFDPKTLQAHDVEGLFAAGEALDIDGPCGGYNLHWAWESGFIAGTSAARYLIEQCGECS